MVVLVRHAQDSIESFDGDWDWATASLHVRLLTASGPTPRSIACDAVLQTPSGRLNRPPDRATVGVEGGTEVSIDFRRRIIRDQGAEPRLSRRESQTRINTGALTSASAS
jgi:hypothetical protein